MVNNLIGIVVSFLFVGLVIGISSVLSSRDILSVEGSRKFIHIGVSNWWIIAMIFFNNKVMAAIVPIIFIAINYLSYKLNLIKAMERNEGKNDLGTVYFPISLLILVILTFSSFSHPYVGALGILIMGYGDGLAAVIGKSIPSRKFFIMKNEKTIAGSLTMLGVSFLVAFIILSMYPKGNVILPALIIASFATFVEAFSPYGLDNLSVPLLTSLMYQFIFFR